MLTQQYCEVGADSENCGPHEACQPPPDNGRSRNGVCVCADGFARDQEARCQAKAKEEVVTAKPTEPPGPKKITVQVRYDPTSHTLLVLVEHK